MRKYGNNMKCAFISVLMNLINGEEPTHNFLPPMSGLKKASHLLQSQPHHCSFLAPQNYQLAQSVIEMLWSTPRKWGFTWMISESVKYFCYQKNVVTSTHFTDSSRLQRYHRNPWLMIHAGLLYSWCFQISSCRYNPSRVGTRASQTRSELEFG